ncbi:MAG: hypothetical protein LBK23_08180 [Oscillospiraceae bacterium]|jgi:hypothetical protein|nr:hypothetical protein [Oscillospiraceae bacterium]
MLEINVHISAPELSDALRALAAAMLPKVPNTAPAMAAVPVTPAAPIIPAAAAPIVPVAAAPAYTPEQIMTAGAALMDANKTNELIALLNAFGVQAVTQLKAEQLGAFATELRKLGAQI